MIVIMFSLFVNNQLAERTDSVWVEIRGQMETHRYG